MFFNSNFFFAFRGSIKYFESAPPELGRSGDSKRTIFLSPAFAVTFSQEISRNSTRSYLPLTSALNGVSFRGNSHLSSLGSL